MRHLKFYAGIFVGLVLATGVSFVFAAKSSTDIGLLARVEQLEADAKDRYRWLNFKKTDEKNPLAAKLRVNVPVEFQNDTTFLSDIQVNGQAKLRGVGMVVMSYLTEAEFQERNGKHWVLLDKEIGLKNTKLGAILEQRDLGTTIPDMKGHFPRMANNMTEIGKKFKENVGAHNHVIHYTKIHMAPGEPTYKGPIAYRSYGGWFKNLEYATKVATTENPKGENYPKHFPVNFFLNTGGARSGR